MYLRRVRENFLRRIRTTTSQTASSPLAAATVASPTFLSGKTSGKYGSGSSSWRMDHKDVYLWTIIAGQAAIILGVNANPLLAHALTEDSSEDDLKGTTAIGLHKNEDDSVISNIHTSKWRVFTDHGRESFLQGKLDQAERFFLSALQEAKEGFGERDPHVASACNNLAELYRVRKEFDKAEPLYLEAIYILEESFGPEDMRVGFALHNLGQFYFVQQKLKDACKCYERALKIRRRVEGQGHLDYADTMYHLGMVLHLQGKEKDAEALIQDSIQILEECGQGESIIYIRRLQYLAQIYIRSNRPSEAVNVQRKILHIMELWKGWNSMDTVIAAERLALTLESAGSLRESQELLERCLSSRKTLLPEGHIQIGANMLHLARMAMLNANQLREMHVCEAIIELDKAKDYLSNSVRIAQQFLNKFRKQKGNMRNNGISTKTNREVQDALIILLQSFDTLGLLHVKKWELQEQMEKHSSINEAENAFSLCISAYKKFQAERPISDSSGVKAAYLSCLRHLSLLISDSAIKDSKKSRTATLQDLNDEIKKVEDEISHYRKHK